MYAYMCACMYVCVYVCMYVLHFFFAPPPPPPPPPSNKYYTAASVFFKRRRQHFAPLGCNLQWCRQQNLHRGVPGGRGEGREGVRMMKCPNKPAMYLVSCFKQTSRRLLELSKLVFLSPNESSPW